jgi:5-(carboxyamino)imidazole ribonucleotide synthase
VVACRGVDGKAKAYPVSENIHVENILDSGIVPGRVSASAAQKARKMAMQVGEALEIRGTYCVEFFLLDQDEILINEIAPRPHNSGHYTLDACLCSQFEQQVRAICSLPLGSTEILKPSVMVNLIGDGKGSNLLGTDLLLQNPHLSLHQYGKPEAKAKRKMGHFTVVEETVEAAIESAQDLRGLIYWG